MRRVFRRIVDRRRREILHDVEVFVPLHHQAHVDDADANVAARRELPRTFGFDLFERPHPLRLIEAWGYGRARCFAGGFCWDFGRGGHAALFLELGYSRAQVLRGRPSEFVDAVFFDPSDDHGAHGRRGRFGLRTRAGRPGSADRDEQLIAERVARRFGDAPRARRGKRLQRPRRRCQGADRDRNRQGDRHAAFTRGAARARERRRPGRNRSPSGSFNRQQASIRVDRDPFRCRRYSGHRGDADERCRSQNRPRRPRHHRYRGGRARHRMLPSFFHVFGRRWRCRHGQDWARTGWRLKHFRAQHPPTASEHHHPNRARAPAHRVGAPHHDADQQRLIRRCPRGSPDDAEPGCANPAARDGVPPSTDQLFYCDNPSTRRTARHRALEDQPMPLRHARRRGK